MLSTLGNVNCAPSVKVNCVCVIVANSGAVTTALFSVTEPFVRVVRLGNAKVVLPVMFNAKYCAV